MMQNHLDKEQLAHQISQWGHEVLSKRQIYSRLYRLLPTRYSEIVKRIRRSKNASKASRLALLDPEYLAYIDEITDLGYAILKAKVECDTHLFLYKSKSYKKI